MKNINLSIEKNDCIGITGKSGIGKSTMLDLMTGIIKPIKGAIYLSGQNMQEINMVVTKAKFCYNPKCKISRTWIDWWSNFDCFEDDQQ